MPRRFAASLAALHAGLSLSVLALGYPHEDAYILFKYARNVAAGFGIVFYRGGPHAEGATDFLWMLALSALARLHIDPAFGAAVLNAIGYGFALGRVTRLLEAALGESASPRALFGWTAFAGVVLLGAPLSAAGALGFSATLYAAIALELFRLSALERYARVPVIGLLLALIRPDGVILGVSFTLLALARERGRAPIVRLVGTSAICAVVGAIYFVWRWRYFGALLPLPLVVKSHYEGLPPGIHEALDWSASTLLPMLGALVLVRMMFGRGANVPRAWLLAAAPFAVHVLAFVPSFPSQNVADRFQAPAALVLFVLVLVSAARATANAAPWKVAAIAIAVVAFSYPQLLVGVRALQQTYRHDYVNPFSARLGVISREREAKGLPPLRIASTEAGRILYWADGPVLDLVGLNSPETAARPPTRELLDAFAPDVVMFHHASGMKEDVMEHGRKDDVIALEGPLWSYTYPHNARFLGPAAPPYEELKVDNVRASPIATAGWLDQHATEYELWAARFEARFARLHVYAIKRSLREREAIVNELRRTHDPLQHGSHRAALGW